MTLAGVTDDPMLASYTLDPARTSHALEALAKDVLGYACTPTEALTGKGKKFKAVTDLSPGSVGAWACERAAVTWALAAALRDQVDGASKGIPTLLRELEMPLVDVLCRIERRGIEVDVSVLQAQSEELGTTIRKIQAELADEAGAAVNLDSPQQLQKLLFEDWGCPRPGRSRPATRRTPPRSSSWRCSTRG